jgi:Tol biopolymer transport system component
MNEDGNSLVQVTSGGNNEQPSVSPDGKWVVYVSPHRLSGGGWALWQSRSKAAAGPDIRWAGRLAPCVS